MLASMQKAVKLVSGKVAEARDTKDVVKLNCVNEKFAQLAALVRVTEQANGLLREAIAAKKADAATHELKKVSLAKKKVERLSIEAEECIGQLAFQTDEKLKVEVVEPSDLYPGDPTRAAPESAAGARLPPTMSESSTDPVTRPAPGEPDLVVGCDPSYLRAGERPRGESFGGVRPRGRSPRWKSRSRIGRQLSRRPSHSPCFAWIPAARTPSPPATG